MQRALRPLFVPALLLTFAAPTRGAVASLQDLLGKGQKAIDSGRYSEAAQLASSAVSKYPKRWEAHRLAALSAFWLDQPARAETSYQTAIRLAPAKNRISLAGELRNVGALRTALKHVTQAGVFNASGDLLGSAKEQVLAFRVLPSRFAFGLAAATLFERAGRLDEAVAILEEVNGSKLPAFVRSHVRQRLVVTSERYEALRRKEAEQNAINEAEEAKAAADRKAEAERRAADAERRAKEAEQRRLEAKRAADKKAEEERLKAEKEDRDKRELDRLTAILNDQKSNVSNAESAVQRARDSVSQAENTLRGAESDRDRARSRLDQARSEKESWQSKVDDAKTEIARDIARAQLRSAESAYHSAKSTYDSADGAVSTAQSNLSSTQRELDSARSNLDNANREMHETEDSISRLRNS